MSAAVDSATASLANTTLNDTSATGGDKQTTAAQNEAVIQSAAEGRRLYIGNVAYATTEGELKEFFTGYLVESISIPTNPRTSRPVGYAFVDVSTPSEAERAVTDLNGKNILDRKVSVQLARKPDEAAADAEGAARKRASGRGRGRGARGGRAGRARATGRGGKAGEADGEVAEGVEAPTNVPGADGAAKQKTPRPPRQRGPPEDGVPSKTKVMVANLPYDLREDKLLEIFKDYEPSGAKLALRPIPRFMVRKLQARGEPRKGRGFAFVTLGSEALQQKAISEMNGKEIEGRELAVKVAIDSPGKEEEALNAQAEAVEAKENGEHASTADSVPTAA